MGKDYSLSSELCLSNWTTEALDNSAKRWMKDRNQQSSASVYVINRVSLTSATVFKTIQSANAVISFLEAVGDKMLKELQVQKLQGLLH